MNYLAIFFPLEFHDLKGGSRSPIVVREDWLRKNIPRFQVAESLTMLSIKMLFKTLSSQITNDFDWESQTGMSAH